MIKKSLILIGAGLRGKTYTDVAGQMADRYQVVAVAEPLPERRTYIQHKHRLPDDCCFDTWEPLLAQPKLADAALICTMDRDHLAPALAAIRRGYDLLLEKPAAPTPEECYILQHEAEKYGVKVLVCHVLRYTAFFRAIKQLINEGAVGRVVNNQHREDVGNVHQSHSFVRGNWGNSDRSSAMILQKSCHDMDILQWLLGEKCTRVQSFGSLTYFTRENAPQGAPEYCLDGCPEAGTCPYNAKKLYLESTSTWFRTSSTRLPQPTDADVERALRTTQYGKCVFKCDNNVVDHQVVNLEFADGATVTFSMCAFTRGGRELRIMGTRGELIGHFGSPTLTLYEFETGSSREIVIADKVVDDTIVGGHGGGDTGIMAAFYDLLTDVDNIALCSIAEAVDNHMIAFAAEESRLTGKVVEMEEFKRKMGARV